jgi:hypothetical protein
MACAEAPVLYQVEIRAEASPCVAYEPFARRDTNRGAKTALNHWRVAATTARVVGALADAGRRGCDHCGGFLQPARSRMGGCAGNVEPPPSQVGAPMRDRGVRRCWPKMHCGCAVLAT